jgi:RNA polymerase sigma-70 factor (ECF subfamily)
MSDAREVPPDSPRVGSSPTKCRPAKYDRPDPRTTSVVAGTRLDLLDALEQLETDLPETVTSVVLRDIYELSYDEIADQVGVPIGTVKSRISRARVSLKAHLLPRQD